MSHSTLTQRASPAAWRAALRASRTQMALMGYEPCWPLSSTHLHPREAEHFSYFRDIPARPHTEGWLASSLLRRIGVLNGTNAYAHDAWHNPLGEAGERWVIEMIFAAGVMNYKPVLQLLTGPASGLPLRLGDVREWTDGYGMNEHYVYANLHAIALMRGELRLRFCYYGDDGAADARLLMAEDGLGADRLDTIVPPTSVAAADGHLNRLERSLRDLHRVCVPPLPEPPAAPLGR